MTDDKAKQLVSSKIVEAAMSQIEEKMTGRDLAGLMALLAKSTLSVADKKGNYALLNYLANVKCKYRCKTQINKNRLVITKRLFIKTVVNNDLPFAVIDATFK